jgi:hypothetical protein
MPTTPQLSQQELEYLHDTDFLLTKRTISQQLERILAGTQKELSLLLQQYRQQLAAHYLQKAGKISRGENYKGLPYLMLDYPRIFTQEDVFAFRTMCWWGHFFSCTLHLEGRSLALYRPKLLHTLSRKKLPGLYICVHDNPWEYHYGPDNYQLLDKLPPDSLSRILHKPFCKISRKTSIDHYAIIPAFAVDCLREFLALLTAKE